MSARIFAARGKIFVGQSASYGQIFMSHYVTLKFARSGATMTCPILAVAIGAYICTHGVVSKKLDFLDTFSLMRNNSSFVIHKITNS